MLVTEIDVRGLIANLTKIKCSIGNFFLARLKCLVIYRDSNDSIDGSHVVSIILHSQTRQVIWATHKQVSKVSIIFQLILS